MLPTLDELRAQDAARRATLAHLRRATAADLADLEAHRLPSKVRDGQIEVLRRTLDRIDAPQTDPMEGQ